VASSQYTQAGRPLAVTTPLGPDVLLLESIHATEAVSQPYEILLDLLSLDQSVKSSDLLKKPMTVTFEDGAGNKRYMHGLVRRFVQRGRTERLTYYRAEVVPALWFLSLAADCRIYQQKTVPEIVKQVLNDLGITDVKLSLSATYTKREYCVQYRETHLAFISRLMEEEGIVYFFEHTKDKHTMVLADTSSAVKAGVVTKLPMEWGGVSGPSSQRILSLDVERLVGSAKVTLVDYVDTMPKRFEVSTAAGPKTSTAPAYKVFDYPGNFAAVAEGEQRSKVRMEELEALNVVATGVTNCMLLGSGQKLDVAEHYNGDFNQSYHLLSLTHVGRVGDYITNAETSAFEFETRFVAIPYAVPYRPALRTPRSIVHGSQTAIVVGPAGEEIYVDKYGRVKVQFFWDQLGKKDDHSSCWVRVSSAWAGKGWGFIQIPRIGQEVLVDFLEGDPDRPIITGRVYNGEQMPPYELPAHSTQSGVKSRTSKGGAAENANELRFEDKKGGEQVYFQAEKDLSSVVKNDETRDVQHDRTTTIKNNETKTVTEGNEVTTISKGNRTLTVSEGNETIAITKGNQSVTISKGDQTLTVDKGKQTITVDKDQVITVKTGNSSFTVKMGNVDTKVDQGNVSTKVAMGNVSTKVDMGNVSLKAGLGKVAYEAMQGIELKVGQSSITIDQTGIKIKGMMVAIEGQMQTEVKGLMTKVDGSAMVMVKGGITMIN
jgi:type VI secretion system secreted protein VgrG